MNVASLKLCKELYELSGWTDTHFDHGRDSDSPFGADADQDIITRCEEHPYSMIERMPAYDLGYLSRRLPVVSEVHRYTGKYVARYVNLRRLTDEEVSVEAHTPEDAAAQLAIELFKQGVLQRQ